jgi:SynChlorMet cassette protein ScmA
MEDSKRDEELAKKMKYVKPELISLDNDEMAEGATSCKNGSGNAFDCSSGGSGIT